MEKYTDFLLEKSMSKVIEHIKNHDCGVISAFRMWIDCEDHSKGLYSYKQNMARNLQLELKIRLKGYGYSKVSEIYIENYGSDSAIETSESSFFIVDLKDTNNLEKDLLTWGELYEQDSVLFFNNQNVSVAGDCTAELTGTNPSCKDAYPPYKKTIQYRNIEFGKIKQFMTGVSGKPFALSNDIDVIKEWSDVEKWKGNFSSGKGMESYANGDWHRLIDVGEVNQWTGNVLSGMGMQADANGDWRRLIEED